MKVASSGSRARHFLGLAADARPDRIDLVEAAGGLVCCCAMNLFSGAVAILAAASTIYLR